MPDFILTRSTEMTCSHGGKVFYIATKYPEYRIRGELPMLKSDLFKISGCPFMLNVDGKMIPNPCISLRWLTASRYLFVQGSPALTSGSKGFCNSVYGVISGPPVIIRHQMIEPEPDEVTHVD